ncbi:hypothetical protein HMPREF0868_1573 [Mageeibacillus indolicus UPII9-5]|uniref:Uncharacterized protein n=1 Tax=Mageeibacillus indolicus (strain UPII9-5) TaxID=699246 RepID=E1PK56_MAGIU|nr:hypothetical protein HMPREF0868_1573 [Mageeibacillus indolicus UPII9-5]
MKYDYAFKLNAVELYRSGQWIKTPEGISQKILEKELYNGQELQIYMVLILFGIQLHVKNVRLNVDIS